MQYVDVVKLPLNELFVIIRCLTFTLSFQSYSKAKPKSKAIYPCMDKTLCQFVGETGTARQGFYVTFDYRLLC